MPRIPPGRRAVAALLVVAVVVLAVAVVGLLTRSSTPPASTPALPEPAVCPDPAAADRPRLTLGDRPRVLIFGDSYVEGYGADPVTAGFAYRVGHPLHWRVTVDGVGGTGYVNPGPHQEGDYLSRLRTAPVGPFDLVVLEGGANDSRMPLDQLAPAVDATVRAVRAKYPVAQIALMGPLEVHSNPVATRVAVNTVLARYAASTRLVFLSPFCERWFATADPQALINPQNGHPDNAGYALAARLFVRDIGRQLSAATSASPSPAG